MENIKLTEEQVDQIVDVIHPQTDEINKEDVIDIIEEELVESEVTEETGHDSNGENAFGLDLTDEEAMNLYKCIGQLKNNEEIDYDIIPKPVKLLAINLTEETHKKDSKLLYTEIRKTIKELLQFFSSQLEEDKLYNEFQKDLDSAMDFGNMYDIYGESTRENMEVTLIEKADKLIEDGKIDQGNDLKIVSATFTDSYKYFTIHDYIRSYVNKPQLNKKLDKIRSKFKRACNTFNFAYQNSRFDIIDVSIVKPALVDALGYTEDEAERFVALFIKYCNDNNLDSGNVFDHTFMYYTISNITFIGLIEKQYDWIVELKNNIKIVMDMLNEIK